MLGLEITGDFIIDSGLLRGLADSTGQELRFGLCAFGSVEIDPNSIASFALGRAAYWYLLVTCVLARSAPGYFFELAAFGKSVHYLYYVSRPPSLPPT